MQTECLTRHLSHMCLISGAQMMEVVLVVVVMKKRIGSRDLNRYLYTNVHSNTIHNSQKVQTNQASNNRLMNKQNVV